MVKGELACSMPSLTKLESKIVKSQVGRKGEWFKFQLTRGKCLTSSERASEIPPQKVLPCWAWYPAVLHQVSGVRNSTNQSYSPVLRPVVPVLSTRGATLCRSDRGLRKQLSPYQWCGEGGRRRRRGSLWIIPANTTRKGLTILAVTVSEAIAHRTFCPIHSFVMEAEVGCKNYQIFVVNKTL